MVEIGEIILNILVYLNLYWYYVPIAFLGGLYYVFIKIFTFPLASNKGQEFIIIARPENVVIQKVTNRYYPFFQFRKGLYWFSTPCNDIGSLNKYHIYIEGLNQDVTDRTRREGKIGDILQVNLGIKQTKKHQILLPKLIKQHLNRHYTITIDPERKLAQIAPSKNQQPFKISLYHTVGIYIQEEQEKEQEIENSGSNSGAILTAITTESVITQLRHIQEYAYFSANSALSQYKKARAIDSNFMTWVKGTMDPKIMATMVLLMTAIAIPIIFMIFFKPDIGEMPTN